jgi:Na+/H+-translocating membrane pyrophosphatase
LLGERLTFVLSSAKTNSMLVFKKTSKKHFLSFLIFSSLLYIIYTLLYQQLGLFVFNRNLTEYYTIALILGTTIISNSIGMILGTINATMNDGIYTMKRSLYGCIILIFGVWFGFKYYGIFGVAIASAVTLFFTNVIFWFFSKKIRNILFF